MDSMTILSDNANNYVTSIPIPRHMEEVPYVALNLPPVRNMETASTRFRLFNIPEPLPSIYVNNTCNFKKINTSFKIPIPREFIEPLLDEGTSKQRQKNITPPVITRRSPIIKTGYRKPPPEPITHPISLPELSEPRQLYSNMCNHEIKEQWLDTVTMYQSIDNLRLGMYYIDEI